MRTTKILAFSVSAEMEAEIQNQAKAERITLSEFMREAIRQYMEKREFELTRQAVMKRLKKKGLTPSDVEAVVEEIRR